MFPTLKDKVTNINRFAEDKPLITNNSLPGMNHNSRPRFLPSIELEKIVRHELSSRSTNNKMSFSIDTSFASR